MGIKLNAIRKDKNVQVSLIFTKVLKNNFELYDAKLIQSDNKQNIAVIIHFGNISGDKVESNLFSFKELRLTKTFKISNEVKNIRVFYWNDNIGSSLEEIRGCYKTVFDRIVFDGLVLRPGDFKILDYCPGIKTPRQGGNGGVVGITEI